MPGASRRSYIRAIGTHLDLKKKTTTPFLEGKKIDVNIFGGLFNCEGVALNASTGVAKKGAHTNCQTVHPRGGESGSLPKDMSARGDRRPAGATGRQGESVRGGGGRTRGGGGELELELRRWARAVSEASDTPPAGRREQLQHCQHKRGTRFVPTATRKRAKPVSMAPGGEGGGGGRGGGRRGAMAHHVVEALEVLVAAALLLNLPGATGRV